MFKLTLPLIVVNMKSYIETTGNDAVKLARAAETVTNETGITIVLAPQSIDLYRVTEATKIPVFAQHIDSIQAGAGTGRILAEGVKAAGAIGTLINHSEYRLTLAEIEASIARAKSIDLKTLTCSNNSNVSAALAALKPDFIAVEPPELIGTGISVSTAKPEVVTSTVERIRRIESNLTILCGAGITTGADFQAALKLGTSGILLASAVTKAPNPEKVLRELAEAVK
ncbi:MAG: triose-phosphate isomerase [Candidatus Ranarchaeia archaeon]|jgi:triosephosphate isomerase